MRKQLCEGDFFFVSVSELWPKLHHAPVDVNPVLLQHMQHTRAANTLGGRPDQYDRVSFPWLFVAGVAKSAVEIYNWFFILPDRHGGSELSELFEVLLEQRFESIAKFVSVQLHQGR